MRNIIKKMFIKSLTLWILKNLYIVKKLYFHTHTKINYNIIDIQNELSSKTQVSVMTNEVQLNCFKCMIYYTFHDQEIHWICKSNNLTYVFFFQIHISFYLLHIYISIITLYYFLKIIIITIIIRLYCI